MVAVETVELKAGDGAISCTRKLVCVGGKGNNPELSDLGKGQWQQRSLDELEKTLRRIRLGGRSSIKGATILLIANVVCTFAKKVCHQD